MPLFDFFDNFTDLRSVACVNKMTRELLLPLLLTHNSIFHKKYVFCRFGLFLTHPTPHPAGVQLQMLSKKHHLLAESCASITQKRSLSQTEVISLTSSAVPLEEGRLSKRKAKDESTNLQNTKTPKGGGELPVPKRLKGKPHNPFLCAVPSCEIVVKRNRLSGTLQNAPKKGSRARNFFKHLSFVLPLCGD